MLDPVDALVLRPCSLVVEHGGEDQSRQALYAMGWGQQMNTRHWQPQRFSSTSVVGYCGLYSHWQSFVDMATARTTMQTAVLRQLYGEAFGLLIA